MTFSSVTGNSGLTNDTGGVEIFGGLAGPPCSSGSGTCNNCASNPIPACTNGTTPLCACNTNRIYNNLPLTITVTKTGGAGNLAAQYTANGNTQKLTLSTTSSTSLSVPWLQLCVAMGRTSCEDDATTLPLTVKIFSDDNADEALSTGEASIDVNVTLRDPGDDYHVFGRINSDGVNGFAPYPGDSKIYMENVDASGSFPTLSYGGEIKSMRVYVSDTSLSDATPGDNKLESQDLPVAGEGTEVDLTNSIVDGLENGQLYFFRIALIDDAGNVVQFFPDLVLEDAAAELACNGNPSAECPYSATPDEVLGLLSEDFNCFIATAAFGTPFAPELKVLREFRSKILQHHNWGVWFIKHYYKISPKLAPFIFDKPWLRATVRAGLWPFYGFAKLSLTYGFANALMALTGVFALVAVGIAHLFKRRHARA